MKSVILNSLWGLGVLIASPSGSYAKSLTTHTLPRISIEYPVQVSFSLESYQPITIQRVLHSDSEDFKNKWMFSDQIDKTEDAPQDIPPPISPNAKLTSLTILDGDFIDSSVIQLLWLAPFQLSEGVFEIERNYVGDPYSEVSTSHWQIVGKIEVKKVNVGQKFAFQDKFFVFPVDKKNLEYRIRFTEIDGSIRYSIPLQIKLY